MPTRRFQRMTLAQLLLSGCAIVFAVGAMTEHARAQYIPPPTPLPPPVFNPSNPYTVPQPPYTPIAPSTPSAAPTIAPGYVVTSPVNGHLPRTAARSHPRTSVASPRSVHHRRHAVVVHPTAESYSYYYYGCAWRRGWDGYWFRMPPCS